jgi:putative ABC transport system substrate-binding protein
MKRRELITLLGGAAAWPLAAHAQQAAPRIGYLSGQTKDADRLSLAAYRRGLGEQGYVEGRNVEILLRYSEARVDRLRELAEEPVRNRVAVIYAEGGPPHVQAAKAANAATPVVFLTGVDPVEAGLVASLNRPGANVTGVTFLSKELTAKRLALLHEVVPGVTSIGFLTAAGDASIGEAEQAAHSLGVSLVTATARSPSEIDATFASLVGKGIGALLAGRQGQFFIAASELAALAARHKLPAVYAFRESVDAGGLMSYGANVVDAARIAGTYTGRILKGEKPADLPVMEPTQFQLVINLKTARTLGLTVPPSLLAIADEVIE